MWPIEARNAAIANTYFVGAINRVGTVSNVVYVGDHSRGVVIVLYPGLRRVGSGFKTSVVIA